MTESSSAKPIAEFLSYLNLPNVDVNDSFEVIYEAQVLTIEVKQKTGIKMSGAWIVPDNCFENMYPFDPETLTREQKREFARKKNEAGMKKNRIAKILNISPSNLSRDINL